MSGDWVVGIDFGAPATAAGQRRKLVAVAAHRAGPGAWAVAPAGLNARLLRTPPGWTARELADALVGAPGAPAVVAADFPLSIPAPLLDSARFAALLGHRGAFGSWLAFHRAVCGALPLADAVDYAPFAGWRRKEHWLLRATDRVAGAQPALKHRFQVLFNMTLLGNAFLGALRASGRFDVVPFDHRGRAQVIEAYPGHAMRALGVRDYKRAPARAVAAAVGALRRHGLRLEVAPAIRRACAAHDTGRGAGSDFDVADALVAAAIAVLHREGRALELAGAPRALRRREGAIWSVAPGGAAGSRHPGAA